MDKAELPHNCYKRIPCELYAIIRNIFKKEERRSMSGMYSKDGVYHFDSNGFVL